MAAAVEALGFSALLLLVLALRVAPSMAALLFGACAGICTGAGLVAFYRALAVGKMGVVTGITDVAATLVAVAGDAVLGGRVPSTLQGLGIALAIAAAWFGGIGGGSSAGLRAVGVAAGAGAAFGASFLFLDRGAAVNPIWSLLAARAMATLLIGTALVGRPATRLPWGIVGTAGVLDVGANGLFVVALITVHAGLATSIAAATPPLVTSVLAWLFVGERFAPSGLVAVGLASLGIALIASG